MAPTTSPWDFGVHDSWSSLAQPGLVACYLADGGGNFASRLMPMNGSVSDLEWADIDGDGSCDHLVAITEEGGVGAFVHELHHLQIQNGSLVAAAAPVGLGPDRPVALEIGDVDLDGFPDYVVAMLQTSGGFPDSSVLLLPGDGAGNPNLAATAALPLPANTGIGSFIPSIQIEDFNGDGVLDLATLAGSLGDLPFDVDGGRSRRSRADRAHGADAVSGNGGQVVPLGARVYFGDTATSYASDSSAGNRAGHAVRVRPRQ